MNRPGGAPSPGALSLSSRSAAISLMGAFSRIALSFECTLGPPTRLCLTLCTIDYSRYTWLSRGVEALLLGRFVVDVVVIVDVHVNVYVHVHVYGRDESPRPSPEPRGALLELALSCRLPFVSSLGDPPSRAGEPPFNSSMRSRSSAARSKSSFSAASSIS